jgi:hypothetical protein
LPMGWITSAISRSCAGPWWWTGRTWWDITTSSARCPGGDGSGAGRHDPQRRAAHDLVAANLAAIALTGIAAMFRGWMWSPALRPVGPQRG